MNQSSGSESSTDDVETEPATSSVATMDRSPSLARFKALAQEHELDLTGKYLEFAFAVCDCSGNYCPLKDIIDFLSLQKKPTLEITVIVKQCGTETPYKLMMKRDIEDRNLLMPNHEVILYWEQIRTMMQHHGEFIAATH
jgi:hypothetical protein